MAQFFTDHGSFNKVVYINYTRPIEAESRACNERSCES